MRHLLKKSRFVAASAAAALVLAACGGGGNGEPAAEDTTAAEQTEQDVATTSPSPTEAKSPEQAAGADPFAELREADQYLVETSKTLATGIAKAAGLQGDATSPAAELRTSLTQLLQEHVYFAGIAVDAGYSFGLDSPQFKAAADALDQNSVALADLVGSVAPDKRDAFLELWREHIGFFVNYAKGAKTGDDALKQQALDNLAQYREQSAAFFNEVAGLPKDAVKSELEGHVETLTAAIDAFANEAGDRFELLKDAADYMDGPAKALAGGIASAAGLEGDPNSKASEARAALTGLLQEHVILAGVGVKTGYAQGLDSEAFKAATETLDANSVALADFVATVAPDKREAFLELWREHIGFFVNYAKGAAGGDDQLKQQALDNLAQYREQSAAFFEEVTGGELPADAVKSELKGHVDTLTAAIDALAAALMS